MATLNLGRIKPVFRGAYAGGTAYVVDDIVTSGNETFICILASTGNATSNATYWTKLAAKGTDGTDVGTTLTTQGDILFRDGSGLQRLAKGTAAQTLQMNGGATAPSWVTVTPPTSEMVKLGSTAFTSGTPSEVNLDVTFDDSTYYKYELCGFLTKDSSAGQINVRLRQASSTKTDSTYDYVVDNTYRNLSSNSTTISYTASEDAAYARIYDWNIHGEDYPLFFKITSTAEMENTTRHKTFWSESIGYRHSDDNYIHTAHRGFFGYEGNTSAITGMNFQSSSGNWKTGHLVWYGFKR